MLPKGSFIDEGHGRISPGILDPAVYTNSVYLNKFSRRLRRGGFSFLRF